MKKYEIAYRNLNAEAKRAKMIYSTLRVTLCVRCFQKKNIKTKQLYRQCKYITNLS